MLTNGGRGGIIIKLLRAAPEKLNFFKKKFKKVLDKQTSA